MHPLHVSQLLPESFGGRGPIRDVARHRLLDHRAYVGRQTGVAQARHRVPGDPEKLGDHLLALATLEDGVSRAGAEQRRCQAVDVRGDVRRLAEQNLWGRVCRRAHDRAVRGLESADDAGDPEIRQLRLAVLGEKDVRRFDVSVQRFASVRGFQRARDFHADVQRIGPSDRSVVMDLGLQRTMRVVLHHDVGPAGGCRPDRKDRDDVRVPGQLAHGDLLTDEPFEVVGVEIGGQHFHRDDPIELGLAAAVHHAESASADFLGIGETGGHQLRRDPGVHIPLRRQWVAASHRSSRSRWSWPRSDRLT